MKLYEIANEYVEVFDKLSQCEEIDNETIENTLAPLHSDIKKKSINIAAYIKNLECEIDLMSEYIKRMVEKKKTRQNQIDNIKNYLRFNMEKTGINKIVSTEFNISLGEDDIKTEIFNDELLSIDYCRKIEKWEPDKIKIKEALLEGKEVDGARLIRTSRLTIS